MNNYARDNRKFGLPKVGFFRCTVYVVLGQSR